MNYLVTLLFLIAGLVNFAPLSGAASSEQLDKLYQIGTVSADTELLLRHRAILFGIVGSIIMAAAFIPSLRLIGTAVGLVSMVSFLALVFIARSSNPNLLQIAWIDIGATIALLLGFALHIIADAPPSNE